MSAPTLATDGTGIVHRATELKELDAAAAAGGLLVFYGRRRVGKTRLLAHWLARRGGLYSQAIESAPDIQLEQCQTTSSFTH